MKDIISQKETKTNLIEIIGYYKIFLRLNNLKEKDKMLMITAIRCFNKSFFQIVSLYKLKSNLNTLYIH